MKNFKRRLNIMSFLANFFLRFGGILFFGIVFCFMGIKDPSWFILGGIFIGLDFILSLISVFLINRMLKKSNQPDVQSLIDAVENDDLDNIDSNIRVHKITPEEFEDIKSNFGSVITSDKKATNFKSTLEKDIEKGDPVVSCVNVFEYANKDYMDGDKLILEGNLDDNNDFIMGLTYQIGRDYENYIRVKLELVFDGFEGESPISEVLVADKKEDDFFFRVRESQTYEYANGREIKDYRITMVRRSENKANASDSQPNL